MNDKITLLCLVTALAVVGCKSKTPDSSTQQASRSQAAGVKLDGVDPGTFNQLAAELALPLFWIDDVDNNGALEAEELVALWGIHETPAASWIDDEGLTAQARQAIERIVAAHKQERPPKTLAAAEQTRRRLVLDELRQGRPTLVLTDLRGAPAADRALVDLMQRAADQIETLFQKQERSFGLRQKIPATDPESRMLLYRNQSPFCVAPATEKAPRCGALASMPKRRSGLYPQELQEDAKFCDALSAHVRAKELMHQFATVGQNAAGELEAVPYQIAFKKEMQAISDILRQAVKVLPAGKEMALRKYLAAAAKAFVDGSWEAADEPWAAMNAENSRWYLRIGPDEVYSEPCSRKAAFHLTFAKINQESLKWQRRLEPLKQKLEQALADLAGPPYVARKVDFHLPDFIDIVLNAGDARSPLGATVGQSLPNWGPVANEGRGRTVVMTNLYTDPDSLRIYRQRIASLFCPGSVNDASLMQAPRTMSTVLHEAAHNLGPAHEYQVAGKTDSEVFGGPLASTMEELKAQTASLYLSEWLVDNHVVDKQLTEAAHAFDVTWAFGQIARGMRTVSGQPKPYPQLASIQVAHLMNEGVMVWHEAKKAHNGADVGCFDLNLEIFPGVARGLMQRVAQIKARGDKKAAQELVKKYVDADGAWKELRKVITERWTRTNKATFVYAIRR